MEVQGNKLISVCKGDVVEDTFVVPEEIERIESKCFSFNKKLVKVVLSNNVKTINLHAFAGTNLEEIEIPDSVGYIGQGVFELCRNLKKVKLPSKIKVLAKETFSNCNSLHELVLPKDLEVVGDYCFWGNAKLENVVLPESIKKLGKSAFCSCGGLKQINLPEGLEEIGENCFQNCKMETITIPSSVVKLDKFCFSSCNNITSITIPSNIKILEDTFNECVNLSQVELQEGVEEVRTAFTYCNKLERIDFPQSVKLIENAFLGCFKLNYISFANDCKFLDCAHGEIAYITKQDDRIILSKDKIDKSSFDIKDAKALNIDIILNLWDKKEELINRVKSHDFYHIYFNYLSKSLSDNQFRKIFEENNFKFFENMTNQVRSSDTYTFYKFCYNLGAFEPKNTYTRISKSGNLIEEEIDYAQKVCEFLKEIYISEEAKRAKDQKYKTFFQKIKVIASTMKCEGFKKEFADFFLNKETFEKLLEEENKSEGFIARCFNLFEEVQKTNTSNKGKQRQLKPTIEKFKSYFENKTFVGEDESNSDIAKTIKHYYTSQSSFDNALSIKKERQEKGTPTRILKEHIKEDDVFSAIDVYTQKIESVAVDNLSMLTDLASRMFTYEFLEKDDPSNYILGKLCSCCAHLEGVGYGIMKASIVHPDIQNIVIKNKKDEIVAKATIYVNRNEGYAICNTFAVSEKVFGQDYPTILNKFKKAISTFAETYNIENPDKPIKQVNVGLGMNDLEEFLTEGNFELSALLKPFNFGNYGKEDDNYDGDSKNSQVVIWKKEEEEEKELN